MQQVISYFNETLNSINKWGKTQLYEATREGDVDSVRFLLQQEDILVNKMSKSHFFPDCWDTEAVDPGNIYETPLNYVYRFLELYADDDETMEGACILELLEQAGGTCEEISIDEE